ncbi:MAG: diacylglycerol kinase [Halothiobacillaceae bacterium]|nr:MAG: diacylglycerol kinase [Halothiobacillaceae bacterium]
MKNRPFIDRLGYAFDGIRQGLKSEQSLRTHTLCATLALIALSLLQPTLIWWALVGLMATLVLAAELINTALEHLADHLHPEQHPKIKIVKDCAAAAVLVLSIGAIWVGVLMVVSVVK